ncbi:hypothetical protein LOK49_LG08G01696 [Camellia lanceoleosa]|uniref:Uncharacterized protein n=1 Tax=Camellia lanceoleosa TaxID=1840588 RepID=A0ACC0GVS1_9ERIC|nr:hypothetical protein LOK49_LG08G01696 [Camellia lanceoleosa]
MEITSDTYEVAKRISEDLKGKRYLLLLDDVKQDLSLYGLLGISQSTNGSKIVLTTRFGHVCSSIVNRVIKAAECFLSSNDDADECRINGRSILQHLKNVSLLDEGLTTGYMRMHKIIRYLTELPSQLEGVKHLEVLDFRELLAKTDAFELVNLPAENLMKFFKSMDQVQGLLIESCNAIGTIVDGRVMSTTANAVEGTNRIVKEVPRDVSQEAPSKAAASKRRLLAADKERHSLPKWQEG